ncbi:fucose 4-O-acetylase [Vibrio azureus]|uniref:Acyltransferase 3 domain-containing protein n=1 Tax=Vibrio azureus NBRC 104587 TaxID=1219077 RepID=U3C7Y2_9VIBR|nr:acyltransferase family protein [Vibrio azureus]AUI87594.1 fucose 4-O-acetylase [Vibrio azureus]GAD74568.1 hypothetical protein VAZ01S_012_00480 [Vibrio azureus NBRC 104587]
MATTHKIASLEFARIIAMFAIIGLHCQMALTYWHWNELPWVGYVINQSARFAVPLFFLISGYLIQPKLSTTPFATLRSYAQPLMRIWLIWSAFSLLMPFNWSNVSKVGYFAERQAYWSKLALSPINSLLEGGLVHLWFIPALVIAVALIAFLVRVKLDALILPVALLLYFYGVLAGSYLTLTDLPSPFLTRNGPFFSTLLVALGYLARQAQWQWSRYTILAVLFAGLSLHFAEAYSLMGYGIAFNSHDYLFGTAIWALGAFMWLLTHPNWGNMPWVYKWSSRILGLYVCHLLVIITLSNIVRFLNFQGFERDIFLYPATLVVSSLLIIGIEKTPFKAWLLR